MYQKFEQTENPKNLINKLVQAGKISQLDADQANKRCKNIFYAAITNSGINRLILNNKLSSAQVKKFSVENLEVFKLSGVVELIEQGVCEAKTAMKFTIGQAQNLNDNFDKVLRGAITVKNALSCSVHQGDQHNPHGRHRTSWFQSKNSFPFTGQEQLVQQAGRRKRSETHSMVVYNAAVKNSVIKDLLQSGFLNDKQVQGFTLENLEVFKLNGVARLILAGKCSVVEVMKYPIGLAQNLAGNADKVLDGRMGLAEALNDDASYSDYYNPHYRGASPR